MAPVTYTVSRRRRWHPVTVAGGIAVSAWGVAATAALTTGPRWLMLGVWLLMGAAAGFATSGST